MTNRKGVLGDHHKSGQTLITPFNRLIGPIHDVSWTRTILPELLWIALLHDQFGDKRAVELATQIARAARALTDRDAAEGISQRTFAAISDFDSMTAAQATEVRTKLEEQHGPAATALRHFISWYPECPLNILFPAEAGGTSSESLQRIKILVGSLYIRTGRKPMMAQATAVWLAFDARKLVVAEGLALAKFPEIEKYPDTELSRKVGSGVRAAINMLFGAHENSSEWPRYFWNRGLEIEPCGFKNGTRE